MSITFSERMKAEAQTRMWVKWKQLINGYSEMIYYSFETKKSIRENDLSFGMKKLINLIQSDRMVGLYEIAIIYDNRSGVELMRFREGIQVHGS